MNPSGLIITAILAGCFFVLVVLVGTIWLKRREAKAAVKYQPCEAREGPAEREAISVLVRVYALVPDLDVERLKAQVHP